MKLFARRWVHALGCLAVFVCGVAACGDETETAVAAYTEIPAEDSCEAVAMLRVANEASYQELDVDAALDRRAAQNIIDARPIETLQELDAVSYVGISALRKILAYAEALGWVTECEDLEIPVDGTCKAAAMLKVANEASYEELDVDAALDRRAAQNIIDARPIDTLVELDAVPYVGISALRKILAYARELGLLGPCEEGELGIVSDLDKTVIPPADPDLSEPPYPGVTALYQLLERRNAGADGDMHYVTARTPDRVTEVPDYLEEHDVPAGPIETGISGLPWIAADEKVRDISGILDTTGEQQFVLFGDSSHCDPEAYGQIVEAYPDRVIAGFIHKVTATVSPHRVVGLHLHESYAEVAALLYGQGVITRDEALAVMTAARDEGLAITDEEMQALLDEHAP